MMYKAGDAITLTELYLLMFVVGFLTDVCQTCETGYYFSDGVCQRCPNNCSSCESASSCTLCTTGYYGETCSESCPVYCHNNMCNQIYGHCLSCIEGYFNDENKTCSKCPDNCATCNSKHFCFACRSGYKGDYCQSICSSCKPGTGCDKNTGYCYDDCVEGFSGELCDTPCDSKCKSCDRNKQYECISCADDRHGSSCNEQCSETCDLNICDVRNGSCTSGCIAGYWGEMCEQICSRQCNNQVCYQSNGECKDGCIDGFSGIDCSTGKSSVSLSLIGGIIACVVVIVCVLFVLSVYIIRKRRIKCSTSSLGKIIHHLLADTTNKELEEEPLKHLNEPLLNVCEDMEKRSSQTRENANINEEPFLFYEAAAKQESVYLSMASDVSISIHGCPQDDTDVFTSKITLPTQLQATPAKQETLPLIHVTAKPEEMYNRTANKETFDMKKPLHVTTHSIAKENTNKAENKPLPDTSIKIENEGAYMDKPLEKQIEVPDIVRNAEISKNARLRDERILKTPLHGKASTISKIPTLSYLKKDEDDETNTFQGIGNNNKNRVETYDDNTEHLCLNVRTSENMKINDNATYSPIQVTRLAHYMANKENVAYVKEFQELAKVTYSINESSTPAKGHMNKLQTNIQTKQSPVILEGEESSNINANFINVVPFAHKAYISYMGPMIISPSCKRAFWKTVWQERCSSIVMLTAELFCLPEMKCVCSLKRMFCREKYGDITVLCNGETHFDSFTVRKYTIMKNMMERVVQRLHFTNWPTYGLPDDKHVSCFVDFVKYANKEFNGFDRPTMVYCRSGKERTGVYIALDILTKHGFDTGFVDIFGCVRQLREQRVNMISDCEQYKFLHKALVISLGDTLENRQEEANVSSYI